jgi:hypothetical protein
VTAAGLVPDAAHLRTLPDGTIISWRRIPGDPTSEAVAFVRREIEAVSPEDGRPFHVTVWISPGGWDPQTIEGAGVTFPCQVVRWGEFTPEAVPSNELPLLTETISGCLHGGTWSREKALDASARVHAGQMAGRLGMSGHADVLATAEVFEAWLDREVPSAPPLDKLSTRLFHAYEAITEARQKFGETTAGSIAADGVRIAALSLAERGE